MFPILRGVVRMRVLVLLPLAGAAEIHISQAERDLEGECPIFKLTFIFPGSPEHELNLVERKLDLTDSV